jgi:hypothetical protein
MENSIISHSITAVQGLAAAPLTSGSDFTLGVLFGWAIAIILFLFALIIVIKMARAEIDLSKLISEPNGDASMSRFQFLIFTFVISLSLFYLVANDPSKGFPEIKSGILMLLGISGGSYLVSKGIQNNITMKELDTAGDAGGDGGPPKRVHKVTSANLQKMNDGSLSISAEGESTGASFKCELRRREYVNPPADKMYECDFIASPQSPSDAVAKVVAKTSWKTYPADLLGIRVIGEVENKEARLP